ncbi:rRNA-processing protein EBP2 [Rhizoctonia solani]|uniref:rRNA-processing protein EBP2 n=1 Tax=Rhizoctonia solani TaxID=456999 RepID=A0A0K6FS11_9AGAM|nr:rRNA-processing protein EBP2 [Rhizoctonia solani]
MARTSFKNLKASSKLSKPRAKPSESSKLPSPPIVEAPTSTGAEADAEPSDEDSEDSEDDGVDEEGMSKLMKLLGDDGLDEIAEQQLSELGLGDGEEDSQDEDEDSEEDSEEGEEVAEDGSDASESGWVDEDAEMDVPRSDVPGERKVSKQVADEETSDEEEDKDDEAVALDEASEVDEDVVPKQKIVVNNEAALKRIRETIELGKDMPWSETLAFTSSMPLEVPDADDDLNRELAFYKQALDTANAARSKFNAAKLPFSRPSDYFAEMVKSDSHMERIRQRLLDERAGIQKSEAAKKQRELKKIGKQVQVEKLKEREKGKKEMVERVKGLKRKRGGALDAAQDGEAFDVAVEDAIADRPAKRGKQGGKPNMSRAKRDAKFGFGGAGTKGRRGGSEA